MSKRNHDRAKFKRDILRGVYDDNLRISGSSPEVPDAAGRHFNRQPVLVALSLFLLVGLLVLGRPGTMTVPRGQAVSVSSPTKAAISSPAEKSPAPGIVAPAGGMGPSPLLAFAPLRTNDMMRRASAPRLNAARLLDYSLFFNDKQVRLSSVFGLDVQTIVIDPGHGGRDPGAIGALGTQEKDIVLDIAKRLRDQLKQSGKYNVILTRDTDRTMSLAARVKFANAARADLFISLHVNALPQKQFDVIETYYYGPPSNSYTLRLARQENRDSKIHAGDFRNMIKKIGDTMKEQESATLAVSIQHSLFTNVKRYDKSIADAGIKIAPFVVLLGVNAPSVLVEISCITNKAEEVKLDLPSYRKKITSYLEEGITTYLTQRHIQVVKGDNNDDKVRNGSS